MTDLSELIARVEKATGPDRELECRVWQLVDPDREIMFDAGKAFGPGPKRPATYGKLKDFPLGNWDDWKAIAALVGAPPFTESIDASLALAERLLPGVTISLDGLLGPEQRAVHHHPDNVPSEALDAIVAAAVRKVEASRWSCELHWFINPPWHVRQDAPTAPLAIILAVLRAKEATTP